MEDESKVPVEFSNGNFRTLYQEIITENLFYLTYNKRKKKLCAWLQEFYIGTYLYCLSGHKNASVSRRNGLFFQVQQRFKWKSEEAW